MSESYVYMIVALLPLASLMLITQTNPYHALVLRAILGAIAALVYVGLGAADVALTEALVGTMLAVTLYIIAVRSSLVMRLGILPSGEVENHELQQELIAKLKKAISKYHLRLELVEYPNLSALDTALTQREIHGSCTPIQSARLLDQPNVANQNPLTVDKTQEIDTKIRIHRLFEILQEELSFPETSLTYVAEPSKQNHH